MFVVTNALPQARVLCAKRHGACSPRLRSASRRFAPSLTNDPDRTKRLGILSSPESCSQKRTDLKGSRHATRVGGRLKGSPLYLHGNLQRRVQCNVQGRRECFYLLRHGRDFFNQSYVVIEEFSDRLAQIPLALQCFGHGSAYLARMRLILHFVLSLPGDAFAG